jgi:uncharacterized membrane protein
VSGEGLPPPATAAPWLKALLYGAGTFLGLLAITLVAAFCFAGACPRDEQLRNAFIVFVVGAVVASSLAKYVFRRTLRCVAPRTERQTPLP